jgi:hypothetical protein
MSDLLGRLKTHAIRNPQIPDHPGIARGCYRSRTHSRIDASLDILSLFACCHRDALIQDSLGAAKMRKGSPEGEPFRPNFTMLVIQPTSR